MFDAIQVNMGLMLSMLRIDLFKYRGDIRTDLRGMGTTI